MADGVLFAEMQRDRVALWLDATTTDGAATTPVLARTLFSRQGCGPTAVAPFGKGHVILCHFTDQLVVVDAHWTTQRVIDRDDQGGRLHNPNDAGADNAGGVYFSASGVFSRAAPATGALLYLDRTGSVRRLASGLAYTNGVVFDTTRRRVLVSEHLGGRILAYPVTAPGRLGRPAVFADLAALGIPDRAAEPPQGPDGLEIDRDGNIYAAVYGRGELVVFDPNGTLTHRRPWSQPLITSVTLSADERDLFLTGSLLGPGRLWPGRVERIPNPVRP